MFNIANSGNGAKLLMQRRANAHPCVSVGNGGRLKPDDDISAEIANAREYLYRFAFWQLRNATWADDVVSETLVAALEAKDRFAGRAQVKTWLVGILKNKIIDHIRLGRREIVRQLQSESTDDELEALLFTAAGEYREPRHHWGDPEAALGRGQFFAVLEACMSRLPDNQGRVFMMREWLELSTEEICKELQITSSNAWILLHRARLRLQECVNINWFEKIK